MQVCNFYYYIFAAVLLLDLFSAQPQETAQNNSLSPEQKEKLNEIIGLLISLRDEKEKEKKEYAQTVQRPSISACPKQDPQNVLNLMRDYPNSFDNEWTETGAVVIPKLKLVVCSMPKSGCTTAKWLILALLGFERRTDFCLDDIDELHSFHK